MADSYKLLLVLTENIMKVAGSRRSHKRKQKTESGQQSIWYLIGFFFKVMCLYSFDLGIVVHSTNEMDPTKKTM